MTGCPVNVGASRSLSASKKARCARRLLYGFDGYVAEARDYVARYAGEPPAGAVRPAMRHLAEIEQVLVLILETARSVASSSTTPAG
jgi:hypothetical protein